jgi:HEAT repeat protein
LKRLELERLFASEDAELRRQAIARARGQQEENFFDVLFLGLSDSDWRVRKEAVAALKERPVAGTQLRRLVEALLPGDNVGLRNAAVQAIGAHGEASIAAIGEILGRLDVDGLKLAAEALALTEHEAAMPWLRRLRDHEDANVKAAAIEAVARIGQAAPEEASRMLDEALDEPDPFLRLVTLDVVRRLGLAPSWERLRTLLADPVLAITGLELAARLGEPRSAPYLVRELERAFTRRPGKENTEGDEGKASEPEARALRFLCRFTESSQEALAAAESAIGGLSPDVRDRMLQLCSADTPTARDALLLLAVAHDARASRLVLNALQEDASSQAAYRAVELLGPAMNDVLLEQLEDENDRLRANAVKLLSTIAVQSGMEPRVEASLSSLSDSSPLVLRAWIDAMVLVGDQAGLERALECFADDVPQVVRRAARKAARAFRQRHPERAKEIARVALHHKSSPEPVCWFISAASEPLLSQQGDLEFLRVAASSPNAETRAAALAALGMKAETEALDMLVFGLSDENADVLQAAIQSLGQFRDVHGVASAVPFLVEFSRGKSDSELEIEALRALGQTGDSKALDFLLSRAQSGTALIAVAALEALRDFQPELCRSTLVKALAHPEPEVVKAALLGFSHGQDIPEREIVDCLSHPIWDVRRVAADVLGSQLSESARAALGQQLRAEGESVVRDAILRSLGRHEASGSLKTIPPPGQWQPE